VPGLPGRGAPGLAVLRPLRREAVYQLPALRQPPAPLRGSLLPALRARDPAGDSLRMADRQTVERVANRIVAKVVSEFPRSALEIDFEAKRQEHEDAYLGITPGTDDEDEIKDLLGFAIGLVQEAFQSEDVYLVARMRGVSVIIRDRPEDQE
jgi:hypothetical protein